MFDGFSMKAERTQVISIVLVMNVDVFFHWYHDAIDDDDDL